MKSVEELVREYLPQVQVMQFATSNNDQPWLCALHFVNDDELNLYWVSESKRRHSQELASNEKAAAYVLVHVNSKKEDYVIGISFEGTAREVLASDHPEVVQAYVAKHHSSDSFKEKIANGTIPLYQFMPTSIVMFNNKDFKDHPRQEWKMSTNS